MKIINKITQFIKDIKRHCHTIHEIIGLDGETINSLSNEDIIRIREEVFNIEDMIDEEKPDIAHLNYLFRDEEIAKQIADAPEDPLDFDEPYIEPPKPKPQSRRRRR